MNIPPPDLDDVFAAARRVNDADHARGAQALAQWRAARARGRGLRVWAGTLLGAAAMLGGALYLQHDRALPASAAYDVYNEASGAGW